MPAAYLKNEGFRVVAYLNMIEIFLIFNQEWPRTCEDTVDEIFDFPSNLRWINK